MPTALKVITIGAIVSIALGGLSLLAGPARESLDGLAYGV